VGVFCHCGVVGLFQGRHPWGGIVAGGFTRQQKKRRRRLGRGGGGGGVLKAADAYG